jgi:hypothetical protein
MWEFPSRSSRAIARFRRRLGPSSQTAQLARSILLSEASFLVGEVAPRASVSQSGASNTDTAKKAHSFSLSSWQLRWATLTAVIDACMAMHGQTGDGMIRSRTEPQTPLAKQFEVETLGRTARQPSGRSTRNLTMSLGRKFGSRTFSPLAACSASWSASACRASS